MPPLTVHSNAKTLGWQVRCSCHIPGDSVPAAVEFGGQWVSSSSPHPAVCLQAAAVCSLGAGVSLCTQGSTCHGCVQFVKSPCLRFYEAALAQAHVTAPTQIKCHLNILAAQYKREAIPSQEYHPLRWEWVIRFPYPHLPPSLSASGIEANEGPR